MTTTDKQSLISKSVAVTRIDIHPIGEEPDQHVIRVTPEVSRTTIYEVPTKLKSPPAPRMKSWLPTIPNPTVILVPHSPSNKPPQSKGCSSTKELQGYYVYRAP
jgi:hypothetical protein